ncbi:hypothetical protein FLONG3_1670 [Fusarium longipes]|uniref:Uncharacterized protein n=1 Tax=Fusarium longipes TaxID=694270 RepID=A0A395T6Q1_9HYPO|nr:hypothetical protein FLONG3_1670 [Fusarium longipes]
MCSPNSPGKSRLLVAENSVPKRSSGRICSKSGYGRNGWQLECRRSLSSHNSMLAHSDKEILNALSGIFREDSKPGETFESCQPEAESMEICDDKPSSASTHMSCDSGGEKKPVPFLLYNKKFRELWAKRQRERAKKRAMAKSEDTVMSDAIDTMMPDPMDTSA